MNYAVEINNLKTNYGNNVVLKGISLKVERGEILSIVGPSGEGKTTLLENISGTLKDKGAKCSGEIILNGYLSTLLEPAERKIGMVFQDLALFPHFNVEENLAFPLKIRKLKDFSITDKVNSMLDILELNNKRKASIDKLSGGEKQRVALGRALIYSPSIVLMDEPLKALDPNLKSSFINDLLSIQDNLNFTLIFVTHDQNEALLLSNRIAVLHKGKIIQIDTPENIYNNPNNAFTAQFFGQSNWIKTILINNDNNWNIILGGNKYNITNKLNINGIKNGEEAFLWVRLEHILITDDRSVFEKDNSLIILKGQISNSLFMGENYKLEVKINKRTIFFIKHSQHFDNGKMVFIGLKTDKIKLFKDNNLN